MLLGLKNFVSDVSYKGSEFEKTERKSEEPSSSQLVSMGTNVDDDSSPNGCGSDAGDERHRNESSEYSDGEEDGLFWVQAAKELSQRTNAEISCPESWDKDAEREADVMLFEELLADEVAISPRVIPSTPSVHSTAASSCSNFQNKYTSQEIELKRLRAVQLLSQKKTKSKCITDDFVFKH